MCPAESMGGTAGPRLQSKSGPPAVLRRDAGEGLPRLRLVVGDVRPCVIEPAAAVEEGLPHHEQRRLDGVLGAPPARREQLHADRPADGDVACVEGEARRDHPHKGRRRGEVGRHLDLERHGGGRVGGGEGGGGGEATAAPLDGRGVGGEVCAERRVPRHCHLDGPSHEVRLIHRNVDHPLRLHHRRFGGRRRRARRLLRIRRRRRA
mmetsp:Transcript_19465/g.65682  ORF Transcript_19465/g.65682 Transcript_19465/m.65682 type:complete len:207 (-) Transcript_19465:2155-2775(-)